MPPAIFIRPIVRKDYEQWLPLWTSYNTFYSRENETELPAIITAATWERFFSSTEPVHAFVAIDGSAIIALVHYLFHRSTTRLHDVCYLQDLFTAPSHRGRNIGQALINAV